MPLDPKFLAILICPLSHAPLVEDGDFLVSTDPKTRRRYRIENGIPNLLISDSEELDESTWRRILERHRMKLPNR
ncbi:MAG: hypothetical protein FJY66_03960 [Calditrichaeota bacterium]|nr:hypothetical protein [Calditrichota bacterium]